MKSFYTLVFHLFISFVSIGQNSIQYDFRGVITTSDSQMMSFKIVIDQLKIGGEFTGYSVTNYKKKDQTKSFIKGVLNIKENKMSFKELRNMETHSSASDSTFCYIHTSELTIEVHKKKNIIKGKFKGVFPSGKVCTTGAVVMVNDDVLKDIKFPKPSSQKTISIPKKHTPPDSIMTANENLLVTNWKGDLTMELWDGGKRQDGDAIAIYLNDRLIRDKVVLKHDKTILKLPSNENRFHLKIIALNEGSAGINTLKFRFNNPELSQLYTSELRKGEFFIINFEKDK